MRKHLVVTICVIALVIFSTISAYAQRGQGDKALATKMDSLSKEVEALSSKFDQVLENQQKILDELQTVKVRIRRM